MFIWTSEVECLNLHKESFLNFSMNIVQKPAKTSDSCVVELFEKSLKAMVKSVTLIHFSIELSKANLFRAEIFANKLVMILLITASMMGSSQMKASKLSMTNQDLSACAEKTTKQTPTNANSTWQWDLHLNSWTTKPSYSVEWSKDSEYSKWLKSVTL